MLHSQHLTNKINAINISLLYICHASLLLTPPRSHKGTLKSRQQNCAERPIGPNEQTNLNITVTKYIHMKTAIMLYIIDVNDSHSLRGIHSPLL